MNLFKLTALLLYFTISTVCAQVTITTGPDWKDAMIVKSLLVSEAYMATTNYGTYPRINATAWTHSGYQINYRSLMRFELGTIPPGSVVQNATLYLYSDPAYSTGEAGNQALSGSNSIYFQKITQAWSPSTVTWNSQPATTTTNRAWVGASTSGTENIAVNVKNLVQDMVNNPASNHGLMMLLENEVYYRSRSYASTDHANKALHPKLVITFTDPISSRMDYIFGGLNQSFINTGVLTDYGMDLADHTLYNGVIGTNNEMTMSSWLKLYASLLSSVINPSSNMIHLSTINERLDSYWAGYNKNNLIVDLPTMFIAYQSLRSDAISKNLVSVSNERLYDVAGRSQSPYTTAYAFATAPSLGYDDDGNATFMFRSALFVNSSSKTFSRFQVDFNDGAGYQTMAFDVPKNISYSTAGPKTLKFKIQFTDGSIYYSHAKFMINGIISSSSHTRYDGTGAQEYVFPRATAAVCPEAGFPNPESWRGSYSNSASFSGAVVTVEYGTLGNRPAPGCNPQFIRPLIVVEGYDVWKFRAFEMNNWSFARFINGATNGAINVDLDLVTPGNQSLGDRLEAAGYDLIFVDLDEGTGDIIRNAYLLENIIRWVNAHKINNPVTGLREPNVVLGQSMGGLIARYAVCDMEKRRIANPTANALHEVRLLVTHDSPHRGANIPLGLQAMVNEMADYKLTKIGLATYGPTGAIVGSFIRMGDVVLALRSADKLLDEPASQQMMVLQDGRANTFLDGEYRTMITFNTGYTPSFNMRALANGSECGIGQLLQPGGEVFFAEANFYLNRLFFQSVEPLVSGSAFNASPGLGILASIPFRVLETFTGKNWKTKFIVRALPTSGSGQVFYGDISVEKKILHLIPVSVSLFNKSRNSTSGTLPWDSAPGGYYEMGLFEARVPNNLNIKYYPLIDINLNVRLAPGFGYIPTASALDIATTPLTAAALSSVYTNGSNSTYPSRFSKFVTQERNNNEPLRSFNNSRHIQFTPRNANWLFNELQGLNQTANNCTYTCIGTTMSPTISGPSLLCSSNAVFTLNNFPSGTTINWSNSTNINYVSGQGTLSYTVAPNSSASGSGNIQALIAGGCDPLILDKPVWVGTLAAHTSIIYVNGFYGVNPISLAKEGLYDFFYQPIVGADSYRWEVPPGFSIHSGQGSYNVRIWTSNVTGTHVIKCFPRNNCGESSYQTINVVLGPTGGGGGGGSTCDYPPCRTPDALRISPNPVNDKFEVILQEGDENQELEKEVEYILFDYNQTQVLKTKSKAKKVTIITNNLGDGYYILHAVGEFINERIRVQVVRE